MVSCLMGDSTALASAIVRCCLKTKKVFFTRHDFVYALPFSLYAVNYFLLIKI